jgi:hypothetical protein
MLSAVLRWLRPTAPDDRLVVLAYMSRVARTWEANDVMQLRAACGRHNPRRRLTGRLAFSRGMFFQVLEGPQREVLGLMRTLEGDDRHERIVELFTMPVTRRRYRQFTMHIDALSADEFNQLVAAWLQRCARPKVPAVDAAARLRAYIRAKAQDLRPCLISLDEALPQLRLRRHGTGSPLEGMPLTQMQQRFVSDA